MIKKDLFFDFQNYLPHSNLWSVIYHEGVRDNHIIFSKQDIDRFSREEQKPAPMQRVESKRLGDVMLSLFKQSDLSSVRSRIDKLDEDSRYRLYTLYRHYLRKWSHQIRTSLH